MSNEFLVEHLKEENAKLLERLEKTEAERDELKRSRGSIYENWQSKYQLLKDSMTLINCYECGAPANHLSPRSRCCICEYKRAEFNAKENEQLRKELLK